MGNPPIITVLMPVFNGEKFLHASMRSVLGQSFCSFEFLVVDDGSTDNSVEIVNSYRDQRIRVVENGCNLGLVESLNKGLSLARGKYVVRMDCDDICLPGRFEKQFRFMELNRDVAVCGSWVKLFDGETSVWKYPLTNEEIRSRLLFAPAFAHPSVIMRRSVLEEGVYRYDSNFTHAEDYDLWSRLATRNAMANIGQVLLRYRKHSAQVGSKHHTIQVETADKVRARQLARSGVRFSDEELKLHSDIVNGTFEPSLAFLNRAEAWFFKIQRANRLEGDLDPAALDRMLASYWWAVCSASSALGLIAWKRYGKSEFADSLPGRNVKSGKLFLKCAVKHHGS